MMSTDHLWEFVHIFEVDIYYWKYVLFYKFKMWIKKESGVLLKCTLPGFPGGAVLKNLPANAGDTGLSPGPGRSHIPWSNEAHAPQLLSLRSRAREPQLLKPMRLQSVLRNKRSHCNEKPTHHNEGQPPLVATRESPRAATKTQHSQRQKKKKKLKKKMHITLTFIEYLLRAWIFAK